MSLTVDYTIAWMSPFSEFRERFGDLHILWVTRLGGYCLGLLNCAPIKVIPALDDGADFDVIEKDAGIRICSLERNVGRRDGYDDWGVDTLVRGVGSDMTAAIARFPGARWAAVCPYAGAALHDFAREAGILCYCLDWDTFWWFSSKANLLAGLKEMGLPRMRDRWIPLTETRYSELAAEFGGRFVAQIALGAAGTGTAVIASEDEFAAAAKRLGNEPARVTPYAGDLSFNINAIATGRGTVAARPSVQIVGQAALQAPPGCHCGNDFSAAAELPVSLLDNVREQTCRIGDWMATRGYRGLFGLDFVVDDATGQACAVDLNARWQGSTSLQAQVEQHQGRLPMAAVELAYQLGVMEEGEVMAMADEFAQPLEGSQLFPKNNSPGYWAASREVTAGVYSPDFRFLRPGLLLGEAVEPEEFLLTSGVPRRGRLLSEHVTLCRLAAMQQAVDAATGQLWPWALNAAAGLIHHLGLERRGEESPAGA